MEKEKKLDISWSVFWKFFLFFLFFCVLYQIRKILILLIFAIIISILFDPVIRFLRKIKIPRPLAVFFVYTLFLGGLILLIYITIPLFVAETKQFLQNFPQYFEKISIISKDFSIKAFEDIDNFINYIKSFLGKITENIFNFLFIIFGGVFAAIFTLTLSLYISLEEKLIERTLVLFFPQKYEDYLVSLWQRCEEKVAGWFFTRILACLFVGLLSFLVFLMFDVNSPFLLSILAAIFNFIPIVGPVITGFLIFMFISLENFAKAVFILIAFILIQQIENNIFSPLISKKLIGIPPVLVLLSLSIGGILLGFLGAILSVPLFAIMFEFLKEFLEKRKIEKPEEV